VFINGITADFFVMLAMVLFENQNTHVFQNFCKERIKIGRSHPEGIILKQTEPEIIAQLQKDEQTINTM
jgi:hypothetical protein